MEWFRLAAFADEASPSADGQFAALQRNSLHGVEMRDIDGQNVTKLSLTKAKELRKQLEDRGLVVWSLGTPLGKTELGRDDFEAELDKLRYTLEVADVLGSSNIRMFSFYLPGSEDPAVYRQQVLDRLGQMAEAARGSGVTLCHENEKGIYGDTPERCVDILTQIPELRAIYDPANFIQCGQDTWHAWMLVHPYVKYMHIKDALADGRVVPPGEGVGQIARLLEAYRAQGGQWLSIEPHLGQFVGLAALEREGEKSVVGTYAYESLDAAFDAACQALKKVLGGMKA